MTQTQTKAVYIIGFLVRFLLPTVFPSIPFKLSSAAELATPINSYTSLQEAFFYLQHGVDSYDGGINHHPPLIVAFFKPLNDFLPKSVFLVVCNFLFAIVDVFIASRLVKLNQWYNTYNSKRRNESLQRLNDSLMVSFYLFNPLIILTNLSHSTLPFSLVFIVESIHQLVNNKNLTRSMIGLAVATYLSLDPILLVVPVLALAHVLLKDQPSFELARVYFVGSAMFVSTIGLLVAISILLTSSTSFLNQCYGVVLTFGKISPNMGLWWYFFTEMFDFFTPFYLGVFNIFSVLFILPITIRFFEYSPTMGDSFLAVFLSYVWMSFLKSYPTVGDLGFAISLIPIFSATVFPYCKLIYITALTMLISLILSPIFYYCWIVLGNGNSNFFYSINLIWGGVHILLSIDFMWAKLVFDYCDEHKIPKEKRGTIRLTQF